MRRAATAIAALAMFLVLVAGCAGATRLRYVDVDGQNPTRVLHAMTDDALGAGLRVRESREHGTMRAREVRARAGSPSRAFDARVTPIRGGTRVELAVRDDGAAPVSLRTLEGRASRDVVTSPSLGVGETWMVDVPLVAGVSVRDGRARARADTTLRLGRRMATWGGGGDEAAPRYSVALLAGPGIALDGVDVRFRPELVLALDVQRTVDPMADGDALPVGPRHVLDLSIAPMIGGGRQGVELGLTFRGFDALGLSARIGWERNTGITYTLGVALGSRWSLQVLIAGLIVATLVGAAMQEAGDGLGDILGGG